MGGGRWRRESERESAATRSEATGWAGALVTVPGGTDTVYWRVAPSDGHAAACELSAELAVARPCALSQDAASGPGVADLAGAAACARVNRPVCDSKAVCGEWDEQRAGYAALAWVQGTLLGPRPTGRACESWS
jgi:hypothetical protein